MLRTVLLAVSFALCDNVLSDRLTFSFRRLAGIPYSCRLRPMHRQGSWYVPQTRRWVAWDKGQTAHPSETAPRYWLTYCAQAPGHQDGRNDWLCDWMTGWVTEWLTARYNVTLTFYFEQIYKLQSPASDTFRWNSPRSQKLLSSTQLFTFLIHLAVTF